MFEVIGLIVAILLNASLGLPRIQSPNGDRYPDTEQLNIVANAVQQTIDDLLLAIESLQIDNSEVKARLVSSTITLTSSLRNDVRVVQQIISDNRDIAEEYHESLKRTVENLNGLIESLEQITYIQDELLKSYVKEKLRGIASEAKNLAVVGQNSSDSFIGTDLQDVLLVLDDSLQQLKRELHLQEGEERDTVHESGRNSVKENERDERDMQREPQAVIIIRV